MNENEQTNKPNTRAFIGKQPIVGTQKILIEIDGDNSGYLWSKPPGRGGDWTREAYIETNSQETTVAGLASAATVVGWHHEIEQQVSHEVEWQMKELDED